MKLFFLFTFVLGYFDQNSQCITESEILKDKDTWKLQSFNGKTVDSTILTTAVYKTNDGTNTVKTYTSPSSLSYNAFYHAFPVLSSVQIETSYGSSLYKRIVLTQDGTTVPTNCFSFEKIK